MSQEQIQDIEENIKEARKIVELAECVDRLRKNRDFKQVIQEGYFHKEAVRLVHLKSDPAFQTPERQKSILLQIDAIGALNQYFDGIYHAARLAGKAIEADMETRDELLQEELNNG